MSCLNSPKWRLALLLGVLTALSGVLLVGVSSWFLAAVALAGLGPAALVFNFHFPAALVRLLALMRTLGKYGERLTGHAAALADQVVHRRELFRGMAHSDATRKSGWQLAKADRLEAFLGDVEADDFEQLRSVFPLIILSVCVVVCTLATALIMPLALPLITLFAGLVVLSAKLAARSAAKAHEVAREDRAVAGRDIGLALTGLVSLEAGGRRDSVTATVIENARTAEAAIAQAKRAVGGASAIAAAFGPMSGASLLLIAWWLGLRAEALLLPVLIGFCWLALGELAVPLCRQFSARMQAQAARQRLALWSVPEEKPIDTASLIPTTITLPLVSPAGVRLGDDRRVPFRPGEALAIVGPSGCGKTSALKRLAGWLPWLGTHPLGGETAARWATHLSLHDAAIMQGTVRENLFSDDSDSALWLALEKTELADRVRQAGGLDAVIRQDMWSLGEARRLALTRALLSDKPIVLFDEPGEHLRLDQAERLLKRCLEHLSDRRVLFVTHQPRLAKLAARQEVIG